MHQNYSKYGKSSKEIHNNQSSIIHYLISSFPKSLNSLLLFQRANKQLFILLGNDIAIQTLNYHLAFIGCMNYAVFAFIQANVLAYLGIVTYLQYSILIIYSLLPSTPQEYQSHRYPLSPSHVYLIQDKYPTPYYPNKDWYNPF